jgi:PiT family inorganic phosphate transporter
VSGIPFSVALLIALALVFDFLNGFRDSASIVATMIASRALSGRQILVITALAEFAGPFIFGVTVATTLGSELLNSSTLQLSIILAALIAAIVWNVITWWLGIPSSSSHALVGGLIGAAMLGNGWNAIKPTGLGKILLALAISPPVGLIAGYLVMKLVLFLARGATPRINQFFKRSQILTALTLAFSYGANDGQKTMGVVTLGLVTARVLPVFHVPSWVIVMQASAIALGTITGSWRIIRTLGGRFYKVRPVHGFSTQIASASVILGAAALGGPVSTTQVISSALIGVGSAERMSKVRWEVAEHIVLAWLATVPVTALLAAGLAVILRRWL